MRFLGVIWFLIVVFGVVVLGVICLGFVFEVSEVSRFYFRCFWCLGDKLEVGGVVFFLGCIFVSVGFWGELYGKERLLVVLFVVF